MSSHAVPAPTLEPVAPAPERIRQAFAAFPSGVATVAAVVEGSPAVLVVSSFSVGISLDPPLVAFAVQRTSSTWPVLRTANSLGISVLGADHAQLCKQLSGSHEERFSGDPMQALPSGALIVPDTPLRLWCTVHDEFDAGDHTMVLLRVLDVDCEPTGEPLVFHGSTFRRLLGQP